MKRYQIKIGPDGKARGLLISKGAKYTPDFFVTFFKECIEWMEEPDNMFIREFIVKQGYSPKGIDAALRRLKKDENQGEIMEEVLTLYDMARTIQEMKLGKGGLLKQFDPTIVKMMLQHHHKYRDTNDNGAHGNIIFNQQINSGALESKSAEELARNYSAIVRGLQGSQPVPISGPKDICAEIE